ncbi:phage GP46 family protein, partial [Lacticaseibacillus rhamnosus]|uniref:phage GP46 family protein n=1 Tax=Lacticaseibacillus rhamnosus TaxID=47715 RepID=UPI00194E0C50
MAITVYRITEAGFARFTEGGGLRVIAEEVLPITLFRPAPPGAGDIATVWVTNLSEADWVLNGPQLLAGNNLDTALFISLLTDRLASADDKIPDGTNDRRGWWGDTGEAYPIGSRLWLLGRAKLTPATGPQCETYIKEALQWML